MCQIGQNSRPNGIKPNTAHCLNRVTRFEWHKAERCVSPRRRLGHENRIMPFRLPQNNHATCDHIADRNSCRRDMTNAGMFLMDSSSPCLFSLASASIMSIERLAPNLDMTLRNKPGLRSPTVRIVVVIDVEIIVIYFCWCLTARHCSV